MAPSSGAIVSIVGGVSSTLAFAFPPPWGATAAAGITLLSDLFGGGGPNVGELIEQAVQDLESFYQREQISTYQTEIQDFLQWCAQHQNDLANLGSPANSEYITDILLPDLQRFSQPGDGGLYNAVDALSQPQFRMQDGVLDVLMLGISLLFLGQKIRAQLYAQLASYAEQNGDDADFQTHAQTFRDLLGDYLVSVNGTADGAFAGWASVADQLVDDLRRTRLTSVVPPLNYPGNGGGMQDMYVTMYPVYSMAMQVYEDVSLMEGHHDPWWGFGDTTNDSTLYTAWTRADVEQHWAAYATQVMAPWDAYDDPIAKWRSGASSLTGLIPPGAPAAAPTVTAGSFAETAAGSPWSGASAVSYAISFTSTRGPSTRGPWSSSADTNGGSGPMLENVPTDPLGLATDRQVWRQLTVGGAVQPPRVVGAILDNTTTEYRDTT